MTSPPGYSLQFPRKRTRKNKEEYDAGMVPVAANHAGDVVDRDQLPGFVADVVPARNLFEDEKAHFVAGIEEMTGLWIVRSAYDVAVEAVSQDAGIATLRAAGHGLADEGKRLMAVEAAELDDCAIELEARAKLEAICDVNHELLRAKR